MNKFTNWWLSWACFLSLQFISVNTTCDYFSTYRCQSLNESVDKYICLSKKTRVEMLDDPSSFKIKCQDFEKPDIEYWSYLKKFQLITMKSNFTLERCPLPSISFVQFNEHLQLLKNVLEIKFTSSPKFNDLFETKHFANLTLLKTISIENNTITLSENTFKDQRRLMHLYLKHNTIGSLPGKIFKPLTRLVTLELDHNKLINLEKDIFWFNSELWHLNIGGNALSTLPLDIFVNLTSLKHLEIDDNNLTTLPENLFENCIRLSTLSCSRNQLTSLPAKLFYNVNNLLFLDLSYNKLELLEDITFRWLDNLLTLNLTGNCLKFISNNLFLNLISLEELHLNKNSLKYFEVHAFRNLKKLNSLDLSDNELTMNRSVDNFSLFPIWQNLRRLNLRNNSFTKLFFNLHYILPGLRELDLSFNQFTYFAVDPLPIYEDYKLNIDLSYNKITTIASNVHLENSVKNWCTDTKCPKSRITYNFNNNHIKCNCTIFNLAKYMQQKNITAECTSLCIIFNDVSCHSPEASQNISLSQID